MDTLQEVQFMSKMLLLSSVKWFILKGKNYFLYRIGPFSKGDFCAEMETGSHKICLLSKKC